MSTVMRFSVVGGVGFVFQLAVLWSLSTLAGWNWLPATAVAVELTIVHNYLWHRLWTWRDRSGSFVRFNASTALTSIGGNLALMSLLVGVLGMPVLPANVITVGVMSLANYLVADRWVFLALALVAVTPAPASASPPREAVDAWREYIARVEAQPDLAQPVRPERADRDYAGAKPPVTGETIDAGKATINRWRGSIFVRGVTVDQVLHRLQVPGTPPPQDDVAESRVLERGPDRLRVYMRIVRHVLVTATYDTEHEMTFTRESLQLATARSDATRIDEVGGDDRGFLWRLRSYWRYEQRDGGVLVTLDSVSLSRDVPFVLKPIANPIVSRIARESVVRTLEALQRYIES